MSHTKGKWIKTFYYRGFPTEIFCEEKIICSVFKREVGNEQADANANLICAAPALLEALELIKEKLGAIYDMTLSDENIAKIDAAIALARGNS